MHRKGITQLEAQPSDVGRSECDAIVKRMSAEQNRREANDFLHEMDVIRERNTVKARNPMKDIILDTNIIIDDPTILARSKEGVRLIVPSAVLVQAEAFSAARNSDLAALLRRSAAAGKVTIVPSSNLPIVVRGGPRGIDYIDVEVLSVALHNKQSNSDTVLATRDLELRSMAVQSGLEVIDTDGLRRLLVSPIEPDPTILGDAKSVTRRLWVNGIFNFVVGAATSLLAVVLNEYRDVVATHLISVAGVIGIPTAGILLFWIRSRWRWGYGSAEFIIGVLITYNGFHSVLAKDKVDAMEIIKLSSGLYVMVRGLDNFGKGLKGYSLESKWKRVFPE